MKRAIWIPSVLIVALAIMLSVEAPSYGESNVTRLSDIEAIKQVMYTYGYELDSGTIDGLMAVFTHDAVAEYTFPADPPHYKLEGDQAIRKFLGAFAGTGGAHNFINPLIEVNGSKATGTFYLWRVQPAGVNCPAKGTVGWIMGRYDNEFRKINGRWRIKHLFFMTQSTGTLDGCKFVP